mgnify:CR=1 FL=1
MADTVYAETVSVQGARFHTDECVINSITAHVPFTKLAAITVISLVSLPRIGFEYDLSALRSEGMAYEDLSEEARALAIDSFSPVVVTYPDAASLAAREARGPRVHEVLLDGELNAGIVQNPRAGGLLGSRNYLVIGLPCLAALSAALLATSRIPP